MNKEEIINEKLNRIYKKQCEIEFMLKSMENQKRIEELERNIKNETCEVNGRRYDFDSKYKYIDEEMSEFFRYENNQKEIL